MGDTLISINPATGDVVGEVPVTSISDIAAIIKTARGAQSAWAELTLTQRADKLRPAGRALLDEAEELGLLLSREMGKPVKAAIAEVRECGQIDATLDEIVEALAPEVVEDARTHSVIYHDPFGVCVTITPWNFPISMPHWMMIPALMAGNAVICKPSEESPLIAQAYVEILNRGLDPGVLQIVHGADEQGKELVKHADLVAFTGSREAGKHILATAAARLTRVVLELGGKDPMIVLPDADVTRAAKFAVRNSFGNAGQVCVSTERIYVHDSIAEEFTSEVIKLTNEWKVGEGTGDVDAGPMINARQRDHVIAQLEDAVSKGAKIVAGGEGHHDNFVMPTVLTNLSADMDIMREETFGPVACIVVYEDVDKAVAAANDTPFGLGATVFGQDEDNAAAVGRRLSAGMIGINRSCGGAAGTPWVGANESGYGYHSSKDGHRQFTQARVVSLPRKKKSA